ncbi:MAG TPA: alpha/beta hydrolase [Kineosporiaceae bacterium]
MAPRLPEELTPPPPRRRLEVVSADGTRIAVQMHGPERAPQVLLAHGWTCRSDLWAPVVHRLRAELRVVCYDQRGHGLSEPPGPAGITPDALAADLAAVLRATTRARRAVVVGHSMGAMSLVAMAGRYPTVLRRSVAAVLLASTGVDELVGRLDLVNLPGQLSGLVPDHVLRVVQFLTRGGLADARLLRSLPPALARTAVRHITLSPSATAAQAMFCTDIIRSCPPVTHHSCARLLRDLDLSPDVPRLTVPAMVLVGTADRLTPAWHARRLAEALPRGLGVIEVPGVGHMTPVQAPDTVASAVQTLAEDYLSGPRGAQRSAVS